MHQRNQANPLNESWMAGGRDSRQAGLTNPVNHCVPPLHLPTCKPARPKPSSFKQGSQQCVQHAVQTVAYSAQGELAGCKEGIRATGAYLTACLASSQAFASLRFWGVR